MPIAHGALFFPFPLSINLTVFRKEILKKILTINNLLDFYTKY